MPPKFSETQCDVGLSTGGRPSAPSQVKRNVPRFASILALKSLPGLENVTFPYDPE